MNFKIMIYYLFLAMLGGLSILLFTKDINLAYTGFIIIFFTKGDK